LGAQAGEERIREIINQQAFQNFVEQPRRRSTWSLKQDPDSISILPSFFESSRLLTFSDFVVDNNVLGSRLGCYFWHCSNHS
jgi:hypothetical protein